MGEFTDNILKGEFSEEISGKLLYGSMLAGTVISHTGTTIIHSMGYPLTYYKDIPHGRANGLLLYEYMKRTSEVLPEKITLILDKLGFSSLDEMNEYLIKILPGDEKISLDEIKEWTKSTITAKNVAVCPFDVDYEKEVEIFKKCLEL